MILLSLKTLINQHQSFNFWKDDFESRIDNDDKSDDCTENAEDFKNQFAEWATKFNISLAALYALLTFLQLHKLSLPKDPHTLLSTPINFIVQNFF